ncbi:hypothetical protein [Laceyella sacchari]|uniref:Peptidase MA superfamily protein n=1 Tax=Laceyella sacchari TaxID=37482 RepID=A0ABY5U2U1_LACSH|nr:hypothetical protein [Laceyella sacchari]UWE03952.1 hypothetical protein NYR52_01890 [Laceyella sacchari]
MRSKVLWTGFCVGIALLVGWCAQGAEAAERSVLGMAKEIGEFRQLFAQKEQALKEKNWLMYRATLDEENQTYLHEQKRWFQDAVRVIEPGSFRLQLLQVKAVGRGTAVVQVKQSYRMGKKAVSFNYPLSLKKRTDGWKDADLAFSVLKHERISVYYSDPALEREATLAMNTLQQAYEGLHRRMGWTTKGIEVKLYHRPEVFRQFVKPSLPEWAGGWHEANQAIKFIGGWGELRLLAAGLVHELTHQMVSELSNDNAAYWLQEGAAMYYEAHLLPRLMVGHETNRLKRRMSLAELERAKLEKLPSDQAEQYYLSAYLAYKSLAERWGDRALGAVLRELGKYPYLDLDSSEKQPTLNQRTRNAWMRVFGRSIEGMVGMSA